MREITFLIKLCQKIDSTRIDSSLRLAQWTNLAVYTITNSKFSRSNNPKFRLLAEVLFRGSTEVVKLYIGC